MNATSSPRPPRCACARVDCGLHHGLVPCGRVSDDGDHYDANLNFAEIICRGCQEETVRNHPEEFGLIATREIVLRGNVVG